MATIRAIVSFSSKNIAGVRKLHFSAFNHASLQSAFSGNSVESSAPPTASDDTQKISKAMKSYMERAKIYDNFMKQQLHEYNIGKRHLANMMGKDPEFFTQEDIDDAIRYLFPSGLFDPRARPMFKHPDEVYPKKKAAEFDITGRPYHPFFYTSKANYYQLLHDVATKLGHLDKHEDKVLSRGAPLRKPNDSYLAGSEWLPREKMESILLEKLTENQYATLIKSLDRLTSHPYSMMEKDFILKYRRQLAAQTEIQTLPELSYDEAKRPYVEFVARRKKANATVRVTGQGSGKIEINMTDIHYFSGKQDKEQVIFPLQFTGMLGKVDVKATVSGGGPSGSSGAIRHGLSMCLRSFVDAQTMEQMRIAGLLSFDPRKKERKKPGQPGARKKHTWKKR